MRSRTRQRPGVCQTRAAIQLTRASSYVHTVSFGVGSLHFHGMSYVTSPLQHSSSIESFCTLLGEYQLSEDPLARNRCFIRGLWYQEVVTTPSVSVARHYRPTTFMFRETLLSLSPSRNKIRTSHPSINPHGGGNLAQQLTLQ